MLQAKEATSKATVSTLDTLVNCLSNVACVIVNVSVPAPPSTTSFVVKVAPNLKVSSPVPPLTLTVEPPRPTFNLPVNVEASTVPSIVVPLVVLAKARLYTNPGAPSQLQMERVGLYKNGSRIEEQIGADRRDGSYPYAAAATFQSIVSMNGSSDYLEFYFRLNSTGQVNMDGGNSQFRIFYLAST